MLLRIVTVRYFWLVEQNSYEQIAGTYLKPSPYRKISGNGCVGGLELGPVRVRCRALVLFESRDEVWM